MKNWRNSAKMSPKKRKAAGAKASGFSILKKTKGGVPDLPFKRLKEEILGRSYELSLVLAGDALTRELNGKHRGKDKPADVLSFPYSSSSGEIFLNPRRAKKEAGSFGMNARKFFAYLFIHGLLHLKGYDHGSRMEKAEAGILKKFSRL